jgi:hypothetical protein
MFKIELSKYRTARVWISELPESRAERSTIRVIEFPSQRGTQHVKRHAAIEVSFITGPRTLYGMLGATIEHDLSSRIECRLACDPTLPFEPLPFPDAEVHRPGLPCEFADAIISSIKSQGASRLGGGALCVDRAAYSVTGSSNDLFRRLSATLVDLLTPHGQSCSKPELKELICREFDQS